MSDGVDIRRGDGVGYVHGITEEEDVVARDIDGDGSRSCGGSGIVNGGCAVGDLFASDDVCIRKSEVGITVHGSIENDDVVARSMDVVVGIARDSSGMGNNCLGVGDRCPRNCVITSKDEDIGVVHGEAEVEERCHSRVSCRRCWCHIW